MHSSSLLLFAVISFIAVYTLPISGKTVKPTATTTTTTTTTLAPTTKILATVKVPEKGPTTKTLATTKVPEKGPTTKTLATTKVPEKAPTTKILVVAQAPEKTSTAKPASKVAKKKTPSKKSKKPKQSPWKTPDADQKKLFNDYKAILRTKLLAQKQNISATYQLEPAKHGSQEVDKTILHHYLIKLPDSKYAHAIIGISKDAKKPAPVNENSASIRRTIYDNLAAAEA